jgi:DNA primase
VVTFPKGEDPDTYVRAHGKAALSGLLDDAVDVLDRKLQILAEKQYFSSIERTRSAVDRLLPTLRAATDQALRDIYVKKVSDRTGVRRETLEAELKKSRSSVSAFSAGRSAPAAPAPAPAPRRRTPRHGAESHLLKMMVRGVEWVERAAELISPEDFEDPYHRAIFQALLDDPEMRAPPSAMDLVAAQRFDEIVTDPEELAHGHEIFSNSVTRIRVSALDRRVQDLQSRIEAADTEDEKLELMKAKSKLAAELREMDPNYWASATRRSPADRNPN